jgi:hypothetical protein
VPIYDSYDARFGPHTAYHGGKSVTPHDTNDVTAGQIFRAFAVTVTGTVTVVTIDGDTITLQALAGVIYPIMFRILKATGTTATGITALL